MLQSTFAEHHFFVSALVIGRSGAPKLALVNCSDGAPKHTRRGPFLAAPRPQRCSKAHLQKPIFSCTLALANGHDGVQKAHLQKPIFRCTRRPGKRPQRCSKAHLHIFWRHPTLVNDRSGAPKRTHFWLYLCLGKRPQRYLQSSSVLLYAALVSGRSGVPKHICRGSSFAAPLPL